MGLYQTTHSSITSVSSQSSLIMTAVRVVVLVVKSSNRVRNTHVGVDIDLCHLLHVTICQQLVGNKQTCMYHPLCMLTCTDAHIHSDSPLICNQMKSHILDKFVSLTVVAQLAISLAKNCTLKLHFIVGKSTLF